MDKPRIFLGSSTQQAPLVEALTRELGGIAEVEPWMTSFSPGTTTLGRLLDLTRQVDFAAFVFAADDWTARHGPTAASHEDGQASPRDNVVFEAGLFGGVIGMERCFILHARGAKLPTDLLGLTSIRYGDAGAPDEFADIAARLRSAIEQQGRASRLAGLWWQFSLTERSEREPSALGTLNIARGRDNVLELTGQGWQQNGKLSARYWSEALKEKKDPAGAFYYWRGERPLHPDAPQLHGTGEIRLESADRARGYFVTMIDGQPGVGARTAGVYLRAEAEDLAILEGRDDRRRADLIAERLRHWQAIRDG